MIIQDKVALVTGGAQGIGRAICEALLKKGAKVVIADINATQGKLTAAELAEQYAGKVIFTECDVTKDKSVERAIKTVKEVYGTPDIIGNNAGILDESIPQKTIEVNLIGVFRLASAAMDCMRADNGGSGGIIVNTASIAGLLHFPSFPAYCASKHGVVGFTRSCAASPDMEVHKVRMNCLCPCLVDTDIVKCWTEDGVKQGKILSLKPLQDYGMQEKLKPAEVAAAFIDLVEDDNKNGVALIVPNDGPPKCAEFPAYL
ncbi:15-hydroxyprostaglandin dehydrogenase [NAD(+)] [Lingula anatina]|uniref:15-hydroxyprostaglandin dehydrogenase [NAD(+)] n=1 Tax=Lingula anatina TaxID=7574 RepID=A0A1S3KJ16_LINAN|nr:15-hydroxyprostaglandin dehydrogenase [NAD(+)] [Lingula anatina]|eukprot:XP_013422206.1 15-hydroxyprostaglandin dehydrogenase [NAD(+)] [Lingula anatina]